MSIKSLIQDMRMSRSQWEVRDDSSAAAIVVNRLSQSCWVNMPHEHLREVLLRIEASEVAWMPRNNIVACAGAC